MSEVNKAEIEKIVRKETEEIHDAFVRWFSGAASEDEFEQLILRRLDPAVAFISPEGTTMNYEMLAVGLRSGYGSNPDFRVAIRNVYVRQVLGEHALVTYEEWQRNATAPSSSNNARISTGLVKYTEPIQWLHIQETGLPESVATATSYDF